MISVCQQRFEIGAAGRCSEPAIEAGQIAFIHDAAALRVIRLESPSREQH